MDRSDDLFQDDERQARSTHESSERIFRLLLFLLANECTRKDVFQHLARYYKLEDQDIADPSSPHMQRANRMFERDVTFLKDQGFEIATKKKRAMPTRYQLVRGSGPSNIFLFSPEEVDCLVFLYTLFDDPNRYIRRDPNQPLPQQAPHHPYAQQIIKLIEKLAASLPPEQKKLFERRIHKPYIYFNLSTVTDYLPHRDTIDTIVRAISQRQQVSFTYYPTHRRQDEIHHEHIDPYYIVYMDGHFYLFAYAHKMSSFIEYRIDRVKPDSVKIQPDMIDVERRRSPIEFTFWINANLAKRGLSERWLTQTMEREEAFIDEKGREQRRILIRATAYNDWRIRQQILKHGEQAELVEPEWLRDKMKETVENMYKKYI